MATTVVDRPAVSRMGDRELVAALASSERRMRAAYFEQLVVLRELSDRKVAEGQGYGSAVQLAKEVLNCNHGEVRKRLDHAEDLLSGRSMTGSHTGAPLPQLGAAAEEAAVSPAHVDAIRAVLRQLPARVAAEDRETAEKILTDAAREVAPGMVTRLGREILARLNPDGEAPKPPPPNLTGNSLSLREQGNGSVKLAGLLDAEGHALLAGLLSPRTAPVSGDEPDRRSQDQRQGDALADILRAAARADAAPTEAGEPVTLVITIPLERLEQAQRWSYIEGLGMTSAAQLRRLACDASIIPAVLSSRSELLDIGRKTRVVPQAIRRALELRDGGCAFPGCGAKAKWAQAHHIVPWAHGGPTSLRNLVLLCPRHHKVMHHSEWTIEVHHGIPVFIPPTYLDPHQRPRTNPLHRRE